MAGTASSAISRFSFHHSRDTHQTQSYTCVLWTSPHAQRPELVRYLLTRLRATDDSLFVRCRLGTNPGGPYADWQMKLFLGGACPPCEPPVHIPGQIYNDAVWPSDDRSLEGMTTQFIFSRVTDHNLLGEKVHWQCPDAARGNCRGIAGRLLAGLRGAILRHLATEHDGDFAGVHSSSLKLSICNCRCFHSCQRKSNRQRMRASASRLRSPESPASADVGWPALSRS